MKKQQLVEKLETAWQDFHESYAGLTEAQMLQPGVMGEWSVKDLVAHISWWEEETLKHLPHILQGQRTQRYSVLYGGIDAFNAQMTEQWRQLSLDEVRSRVAETHQKLLAFIQGMDEEQFRTETRARRRIRLDTFGHYPFHAQAIREWRGSAK